MEAILPHGRLGTSVLYQFIVFLLRHFHPSTIRLPKKLQNMKN
jgi:hypothetical protein